METVSKQENPWSWVPSLYILEALPFIFVNNVSLVIYKNLNINNSTIAFFTSLFAIPLFLKPLIAPFMENFAKRTIILLVSFSLCILLLLFAASLQLTHFFLISILILFAIAFTSAINDIHTDGFYIITLNSKQQAAFIGIRTVFYQIGRLICQGGLIFLASLLFVQMTIISAWQVVTCLLTLLIFSLTCFHYFILPRPETEKHPHLFSNFLNVLNTFVKTPQIWLAVGFVFIYNFGENQLIKIVPLFMLDPAGLALNTAQVGIIYGVLGVLGMLFGVFLSGNLSAKHGLKQVLLPITLIGCLTNFGYLYLSLYDTSKDLYNISIVIMLAQVGYGLMNGVYMYYIMQHFGKGKYAMSQYAIGTSLMAIGMILGGAISGYIQEMLGYRDFFIWIMLVSLCIILFTGFVTLRDKVIE